MNIVYVRYIIRSPLVVISNDQWGVAVLLLVIRTDIGWLAFCMCLIRLTVCIRSFCSIEMYLFKVVVIW